MELYSLLDIVVIKMLLEVEVKVQAEDPSVDIGAGYIVC